MHDFPHVYRVVTTADSDDSDVILKSEGRADLATAPPAEVRYQGEVVVG